MEQKSEPRVHRVGSVTLGMTMVLFGILFLLHTLGGLLTYQIIWRLWPVILVSMGIEVLFYQRSSSKQVYDKGSVVILILIGIFSAAMAMSGVVMEILEKYPW